MRLHHLLDSVFGDPLAFVARALVVLLETTNHQLDLLVALLAHLLLQLSLLKQQRTRFPPRSFKTELD